MQRKIPFSLIKMVSINIQISALDGEDIPLCIVIRRDHYYYDIMNRTVLCVDTQSAHLKDILILI